MNQDLLVISVIRFNDNHSNHIICIRKFNQRGNLDLDHGVIEVFFYG